jgi:hypothetical protein
VTRSFGGLFGSSASLGGGGVAASLVSGGGSSSCEASAQWRCGLHGGDGSIQCGPMTESTQHEVGRYNPRGGGSGVACAQ